MNTYSVCIRTLSKSLNFWVYFFLFKNRCKLYICSNLIQTPPDFSIHFDLYHCKGIQSWFFFKSSHWIRVCILFQHVVQSVHHTFSFCNKLQYASLSTQKTDRIEANWKLLFIVSEWEHTDPIPRRTPNLLKSKNYCQKVSVISCVLTCYKLIWRL